MLFSLPRNARHESDRSDRFMAGRGADRAGFTLVELLLAIGIIALLAAIVMVAINPTKQIADARDAQRRSDVSTILNAVYQYVIDNNGILPISIQMTPQEICLDSYDPTACMAEPAVNLRMLTGSYLAKIPRDPRVSATGTGTRYYIIREASGRITVSAPDAERGAVITVNR